MPLYAGYPLLYYLTLSTEVVPGVRQWNNGIILAWKIALEVPKNRSCSLQGMLHITSLPC